MNLEAKDEADIARTLAKAVVVAFETWQITNQVGAGMDWTGHLYELAVAYLGDDMPPATTVRQKLKRTLASYGRLAGTDEQQRNSPEWNGEPLRVRLAWVNPDVEDKPQ